VENSLPHHLLGEARAPRRDNRVVIAIVASVAVLSSSCVSSHTDPGSPDASAFSDDLLPEARAFNDAYADALFSPVTFLERSFTISSSDHLYPWDYWTYENQEARLVEPRVCPSPADLLSESPWVNGGYEDAYDYSVASIEADRFGSYKRIKATLRDEYIESIPLRYSDQKMISNFSASDMHDAIRLVSDYALNEVVDSIAVDNYERFPEWLDTVGADFLTDVGLASAQSQHMSGAGRPIYTPHGTVDVFSVDEETSTAYLVGTAEVPLLRDGGSRIGNKHLHGFRFHRTVEFGHPTIEIEVAIHYHTHYNDALHFKTGYPDLTWHDDEQVHRAAHHTAYLNVVLVWREDMWRISETSVESHPYYGLIQCPVEDGDEEFPGGLSVHYIAAEEDVPWNLSEEDVVARADLLRYHNVHR